MLTGNASSTDSTTLIGLTRFLTNTADNVNAFTDANIVALLNIEYRETQALIVSQMMYDWKENTVNGTSSGLINLVAGTNNYAFPSGLLTLDRVEVNYMGTGNSWVEATPIKMEAMNTALANTTGNVPLRGSGNNPVYWVRGSYIYLDPIPSSSVTGGLKVWCTTLVTDLAIGEAVGPVFATPYHQILSYGVAARYFMQKNQYNDATAVEQKKLQLRADIIQFYSSRLADKMPSITPRERNLR